MRIVRDSLSRLRDYRDEKQMIKNFMDRMKRIHWLVVLG